MKMTIISDIKSEKGSIITYGLHPTKSIVAEVDIAHVQKINPDLILFAARPPSLLKNRFRKDPVKKPPEQTDTPILYCCTPGSG